MKIFLIFIIVLAFLVSGFWFLTSKKPIAGRLAEISDFLASAEAKLKVFFSEETRKESQAVSREKSIIWCGESCFWLGEDGLAFLAAARTEGSLVPVVYEEPKRELLLGEKIVAEKQAANIYAVAAFLKKLGLSFSRINIFDLAKEEAVVEVESGPKIYFSLRFKPDFAVPIVKSLKESAEWGKISYIDLLSENRVFYKNK
jgi:hypothetical protein